jgi:hypothetical protein
VSTQRALRVASMLLAIIWAGEEAVAQIVIGRYAGEFLSLGAGARALAMGNAATAAPGPWAASYYNPSALAGLQQRHAEFMHASQFDNLYTYDYLSFSKPLSGGMAGSLTALYTRVGDIPMTKLSDPNQPLSDANRVVVERKTGDNELALLGGVGRTMGHGWRTGANAKLLYKSVAREMAFGLGFDVGVGRTLVKGLDVGLVARDLTTSVLGWSTGRTEAILPSVSLGGAWSQDLPGLNAKATVAADLENHFESRGAAEAISAGPLSAEPHVGVEYLIANTVALRGGLNGSADKNNITAGAGLRLAWMNVNVAFQNHADLGFTHRVSLGVVW